MGDNYRELQEAARDALYELLRRTEPGTGLQLHKAYAGLEAQLGREDREEREREQREARNSERARQHAEREQYFRARLAWTGLPMAERGHRVLNIIGDERLTIRQVHEQLVPQMPEARIYQPDVRTVIRLLHERGELDRAAEPVRPGGASIRFRYFRRAVDPKLAGLERQLNDKEA